MKRLILFVALTSAVFAQPTPVGGPPAANQSEVNAGTVTNKYVSPATLANWTGDAGGDVVGPASSTDNAIVRFDGTTGKLLQNSGATIGDTGLLTLPNGAAATPSLNLGDSTTGLFRPGSNQIGFALGGTAIFTFTASGSSGVIQGSAAGPSLTLGSSGSVSLDANGTNQNITLTPSGTGSSRMLQSTVGNAVVTILSTATNDDPSEIVYQNRAATTDGSATTLHTFTIAATTTYTIEISVTARRTGGTAGSAEDGASYKRVASVKNVAGTATLIGAVTAVSTQEDQAGWDCTIDVTSNTARVRVTGATDNNVTWHVTARVSAVSS